VILKASLVFDEPVYVTRPVLPDVSQVIEKIRDIWDSKWLTNNGPQHALFEQKLIGHLKVRNLSLFNNGTIALMTAVQSLHLSGEVITTPFTFPATPHALTLSNIKPVFCDIDSLTMNIDATKIESMITSQTTGILAVHVYGTPCDLVKIQAVADYFGLKVIYDAAHAFGVEVEGQGIGTFGDITMFSFHATKLFHTAEGGALTYCDPNLKPGIDLLKNFGIKSEEEVVMPGINGKMNELQAALGLIMLDYVEAERAKREHIMQIYKDALQDVSGIRLTFNSAGVKNSYQYFVIRIDKEQFGLSRDEVYERFKRYNVFTRKYFFPLCSEFPCYRKLPSSAAWNLPTARKIAKEVLCLPFYGELEEQKVMQICEILIGIR
jgi:dTDP-4-amino-4,6-dideoxygalactose transaminase